MAVTLVVALVPRTRAVVILSLSPKTKTTTGANRLDVMCFLRNLCFACI